MNVSIRFHQLQRSASLHRYVERRVHRHLQKFGHMLSDVCVRLADVNGPKGGDDKLCQITVHSPVFGKATLSETKDCAYSAVDAMMKKLSRTVQRKVSRRTTHPRVTVVEALC